MAFNINGTQSPFDAFVLDKNTPQANAATMDDLRKILNDESDMLQFQTGDPFNMNCATAPQENGQLLATLYSMGVLMATATDENGVRRLMMGSDKHARQVYRQYSEMTGDHQMRYPQMKEFSSRTAKEARVSRFVADMLKLIIEGGDKGAIRFSECRAGDHITNFAQEYNDFTTKCSTIDSRSIPKPWMMVDNGDGRKVPAEIISPFPLCSEFSALRDPILFVSPPLARHVIYTATNNARHASVSVPGTPYIMAALQVMGFEKLQSVKQLPGITADAVELLDGLFRATEHKIMAIHLDSPTKIEQFRSSLVNFIMPPVLPEVPRARIFLPRDNINWPNADAVPCVLTQCLSWFAVSAQFSKQCTVDWNNHIGPLSYTITDDGFVLDISQDMFIPFINDAIDQHMLEIDRHQAETAEQSVTPIARLIIDRYTNANNITTNTVFASDDSHSAEDSFESVIESGSVESHGRAPEDNEAAAVPYELDPIGASTEGNDHNTGMDSDFYHQDDDSAIDFDDEIMTDETIANLTKIISIDDSPDHDPMQSDYTSSMRSPELSALSQDYDHMFNNIRDVSSTTKNNFTVPPSPLIRLEDASAAAITAPPPPPPSPSTVGQSSPTSPPERMTGRKRPSPNAHVVPSSKRVADEDEVSDFEDSDDEGAVVCGVEVEEITNSYPAINMADYEDQDSSSTHDDSSDDTRSWSSTETQEEEEEEKQSAPVIQSSESTAVAARDNCESSCDSDSEDFDEEDDQPSNSSIYISNQEIHDGDGRISSEFIYRKHMEDSDSRQKLANASYREQLLQVPKKWNRTPLGVQVREIIKCISKKIKTKSIANIAQDKRLTKNAALQRRISEANSHLSGKYQISKDDIEELWHECDCHIVNFANSITTTFMLRGLASGELFPLDV